MERTEKKKKKKKKKKGKENFLGRTLFGFLYGVHGVPHFLFPGSLISIFFGVQRTAHLNRNDDDDSSSIVKLQDENLGAFSFSGFINFPDLAIETDLHPFLFLLLFCFSFCCGLQGEEIGSSLSRNSVLLTDTRDLKAKLSFIMEPPLQADPSPPPSPSPSPCLSFDLDCHN